MRALSSVTRVTSQTALPRSLHATSLVRATFTAVRCAEREREHWQSGRATGTDISKRVAAVARIYFSTDARARRRRRSAADKRNERKERRRRKTEAKKKVNKYSCKFVKARSE